MGQNEVTMQQNIKTWRNSVINDKKPDVIHVGMINGNFTRSGQYSSKFIDLKVNHCLFPLLVAIFCTHVTWERSVWVMIYKVQGLFTCKLPRSERGHTVTWPEYTMVC